jgi:hypothetical protein
MSYHQLLLIGDSNVARFLPGVKTARADQELQATTLLRATNLVQVKDHLTNPTQASEHVVLAALTNLVTSFIYEDSTSLAAYCEKTFASVMSWVETGRSHLTGALANVSVFLVPRSFGAPSGKRLCIAPSPLRPEG